MKNLTATICLTITLLLGSVGASWSADWNKGLTAFKSGDYATALREWTPLAEKGNARAQNAMGNIYKHGLGVPKDDNTALKWYRLSAENGEKRGQFSLGLMYASGKGVPLDYKTALKWWTLAAKQGHANALNSLMVIAEKGLADAQRNLGVLYENGQGVPKDYKTAVKWYRLAAKQGNAFAQNNLGSMYSKGQGVQRDDKTAVKWFRLSAKQGNAPAQYNLGEMYYDGKGVPKNFKTAVKWYKLAAKQGDARAQKQLAKFQEKIADQNKLRDKLRELQGRAEQGNVSAQLNLGVMYKKGRGVPQDYKIAVKWYKLAAEQGNADAQFTLGFMYDSGQGALPDDKTALKWYKLAAKQGDARAQKKVEKFQEKIAIEKQKIAIEKQLLAREKQSISNPGFRDLKPGIHRSTIADKNLCKDTLNYAFTTCYGLDNYKFGGGFDINGSLDILIVDLGPIVGSVDIISEMAKYLQKGETNIYLNMRTILGKKYKLDFEYSERDRQLFNKNEKDKLYTVYEKGQVALLVERKKKNYSHELWLYIEYRDVKPAEEFFKEIKPKRAKADDF